MDIIATDLDRTLFPNGKQPYDRTMPFFCKVVAEHRLPCIYGTGRNLRQIKEGMKEYRPPPPQYAIAEVGTRIYAVEDGNMVEDAAYLDFVHDHTPGWNLSAFQKALTDVANLRLQEAFNQNRFKQSYYVDDLDQAGDTVATVAQRIRDLCEHTSVTYSVDETIGQGLLDVLPARANKMEGLEFVRAKLGAAKEEIVYCGDSGNDLQPLTFGYRAILVRNAIDAVREEAVRLVGEKGFPEKLYLAEGNGLLNGYYVSGILEGLLHFGVIAHDEVADTLSAAVNAERKSPDSTG